MNYQVRIIKEGKQDEVIPCTNKQEAERTVENLKTAFAQAVRLGTMRVIIEER